MNIETTDNSPLRKEEPLGIIEAHGINYPPF